MLVLFCFFFSRSPRSAAEIAVDVRRHAVGTDDTGAAALS